MLRVPSSRVWQQVPCAGPQLHWESLRNPSMKSISKEQTIVTQPLPLPLGTIAIRQLEIQAEEILPSLPQIWQAEKKRKK